jgi:hypothetical protein
MHITYRYQEFTTYIEMKPNHSVQQRTTIPERPSVSYEIWLSTIHNRINDLKEEQQYMMKIAMKLSYYLHRKAISPYNDDFVAYLDLFIHEEQLKQTADGHNQIVIEELQRLSNRYKQEIELFKSTVPKLTIEQKFAMGTPESTIKGVKEIFDLVKKLYALPINGSLIREQVEGLKHGQSSKIGDDEISISVPCYGPVSCIVEQLDIVFSPTIVTVI